MARDSRRDVRALLLGPSLELASAIDARLTAVGLPIVRPVQAQLLTLVEPAGMRLSELVAVLGVAKQTLGDLVDDLERERLVERYPDPDHGVIKRVRLAARGKQWAGEVRRAADGVERAWAGRLGKVRSKQLRTLLEALAAAPR
ncbi:MAG: MarR family winged helix-turn-helix transcriptional regulator [Kofleriaceae bacterium]